MSNDANKLATFANQQLCLANARLSNAYYYQSLPFCIIDSIYSLGVRYGQVEKIVCHFSKKFNWQLFRQPGSGFPKKADQKKVSDLTKLFESVQSPEENLFNNRGYANPSAKKGRILKAELVRRFAIELKDAKIETFQDLEAFTNPTALDEKLCSLPALKSKVAVRYFRMLAGDETQVKPDRMVLAFIKDALGQDVTPDDAAELVQDACGILNHQYPQLTPRHLDHEIWKHQRNV